MKARKRLNIQTKFIQYKQTLKKARIENVIMNIAIVAYLMTLL